MKINESFRNWTRGVSFTLTMGKSQVALLVSIHYSKEFGMWIGLFHKALRLACVGREGLVDRGLLVSRPATKCQHGYTECTRCKHRVKVKDRYEITEAGEKVVDLLKISGVYQELVKEFESSDRQRGIMREVV